MEYCPDFHQEMVSKLKSLDSDDSLQSESKLIVMLRGDSKWGYVNWKSVTSGG